MNPTNKAKWIAALRSGDYKQGHNILRSKEDNFCCLGVACDLAAKEGIGRWEKGAPAPRRDPDTPEIFFAYDFVTISDNGLELKHTGTLPPAVREWLGVDMPDPKLGFDRATQLNDAHKLTFHQIAAIIERDENET